MILLLASEIAGPSRGGIAAVNGLVLAALAETGTGAEVLTLLGPRGPAEPAPGIRARGFGGRRAAFALAAAAARRRRGDVVLATHVGLAAPARLARGRGRMAMFLHGVEAWGPLPARTRWGLARADLLLANSAHTLARFRSAHAALAGLPAEVCPLAPRDLGPGTGGQPPPAESRAPAVLVVGRLWDRGLKKGQETLIRLWPRVRERIPGAELWIAGGGDGRSALERLAAETGVAGAVRFHGAVDDAALDGLYRAASALAMVGEGEGFGLAFVEAMERALPCIASRDDAGAEVVGDGEGGLAVDPAAPEDLLRAVIALLGDAGLRARLGAGGRDRVARCFSREGFRARIMGALRRLGGDP